MRRAARHWKGPYWEPRDVWIGVYWTRDEVKITRPAWDGFDYRQRMTAYICLVPCFPIRVWWWLGYTPSLANQGAMSPD